MLYVGAVAYLAEQANHHPDVLIQWNKVTLTLVHALGGRPDRGRLRPGPPDQRTVLRHALARRALRAPAVPGTFVLGGATPPGGAAQRTKVPLGFRARSAPFRARRPSAPCGRSGWPGTARRRTPTVDARSPRKPGEF